MLTVVQYARKKIHTTLGATDIQSCPIKLPPLFRAPAVWVENVRAG